MAKTGSGAGWRRVCAASTCRELAEGVRATRKRARSRTSCRLCDLEPVVGSAYCVGHQAVTDAPCPGCGGGCKRCGGAVRRLEHAGAPRRFCCERCRKSAQERASAGISDAEAARMLGLSLATFREWVSEYGIVQRIGRGRRITVDPGDRALLALVARLLDLGCGLNQIGRAGRKALLAARTDREALAAVERLMREFAILDTETAEEAELPFAAE